MERTMSQISDAVAALQAQVTAQTTVEQSAITLIQGIAAQLAAALANAADDAAVGLRRAVFAQGAHLDRVAMGRGTIDATTTVPAAVVDFGIDRVTSYDYLIQLGTNPFAVLMNRKKFESMPKAAQDQIAKYSPGWINDTYIKNLSAYNEEVIGQFRADKKRTVVTPADADMPAIKAASEKVTADWAAKSPENAQLLAKARALLADIRAKK
jgi:hypothetical protein